MPREDFPAAHSMDSAWFAVDRDGFVAYFYTGEAGAMPRVGYTGEEAFELQGILIRDLPTTDILYDPRGRVLPGQPSMPLDLRDYSTLLFLSHLGPVQSDIEAGRATAVRATEGYAVTVRRVTAELFRRLTDSGALVGWDYHFDESENSFLARHGLYEYGHLCENWVSGPYGRKRVPGVPVHVDQLKPNIRTNLKQAHLPNLRFADTNYLQPAEHWDCASHEEHWLGLDGVTREFGERSEGE
ncbi:MAG TPA: hypothetical protein VKE40_09315 [Gemmataceae bacterium]|nr:hypothetical protein [Gemmataceae bacterium]